MYIYLHMADEFHRITTHLKDLKYFDLNDMKIIRKEIISLYVMEILKIPTLQLVVCHREQIVLKL